jgi:uncharacterized protein YjbJ (UPF0337 family)
MNKDQVKGTVKETAGMLQAKAAKMLGNKEQEAKGNAREAQGKAEQAGDDKKKKPKDATK